MTQQTSIWAYQQLEATGRLGELQLLVLYVLAHAERSLSQREVWERSKHQNLPSITPRLKELMKMGLVLEHGQIICPVTKKTVNTYVINPNPDLNFQVPVQPKKPKKLTLPQARDLWMDLHRYREWALQSGNFLHPGTIIHLADLDRVFLVKP